ncbi:tRNA-guanine transglycosylase [Vittaforma corneae ATCC 50505]|uniref:tRNA-guanine transglycosylase n=1 Tax=Vittaforma corneae (strain ATCC 50505) TaxID=993615 RepID=L2GJL2_VITCO|nr:tRNA-guanine transglycosylase [Vittaforma corneae ATCC 50505]ELA41046.1 tRNA-guanine transglycosylase [Vittaforma corneae ATCC 50505]
MFGEYKVIKKCKTTNARVSELELKSNTLHLPIFMPVATYGAMRGVKVSSMPEEIILSNTYHLRKLGKNIKEFMKWSKSMLTDSGGFQIQSLPNVDVTDDGVIFDNKLFRPEDSMDIQMCLGADIMMQLDDVVNPKEERAKHVKAVKRSIEWLDRAIMHIDKKRDEQGDQTSGNSKKIKKDLRILPIRNQVLFPIIQGGLEEDLRKRSIEGILERRPIGVAIGGLSGGEDKGEFCRIVLYCCNNLPEGMPRYLMGVGYPEDIVVCCALGVDMSDCVYPTRTARFGRAFRDEGDILIDGRVLGDLTPIDKDCQCSTCKTYNKSYLLTIKGTQNFCMLVSIHNMHYMRNLTQRIRKSILSDNFPKFVKEYMENRFKDDIPLWIKETLSKFGINFIQ